MSKQTQLAQLQEYNNFLARQRADREEILTDRFSRQRAEEALMEGFPLQEDHWASCNCEDCEEIAGQMVDAVIEAWRGR